MQIVCFVNTSKSWGGGEKWHFEMALFLKENGFRVVILTNQNSELYKRARKQDVEVKQLPITNFSFLNPLKFRAIAAILSDVSPDVILLNSPIDIKTVGVTAATKNVKHIIYRRGSDIPIKNSFLNRIYFKHVITGIIANSKATKKSILKKNPNLFPKNKIKVIYNGLDVDKFNVPTPQDSPGFVIGNLGRLVYQKNQKALIDLAALLKDELKNFKVRIGGGGPLLQTLIDYAKEKRVEHLIQFTGEIKNPVSFLKDLDVFILPSHWEGFGYVIAEASLLEKPVIAFDISSNPELVKNNETGFLIKKDDLQAMKDKILQFYSSPEIRQKFGVNGRKYILDNFDAKQNRKKIVEYINNLLHTPAN
ncbi:glycosyltransferase family 4 protein [Salinimicrobium terrae]|uniref:glycosyltransferase family 4 protein n=1 Tax=Salinimicrobium terrae TaxID=470866 RepID=UPI00040C8553|nr:glycosyltransferase family 4 protein [Salinimicrobium terrae]